MRMLFYILIGIIFISFGAYILYSGYEIENPTISGFGFAAIIIGAMFAMFGVSQRKKAKAMPDETASLMSLEDETPQNVEEDSSIEIHAIIQSMGVVAVADKRIRQEEVETIASIYEEMLGMKIQNEEVRSILDEFDDHFDIEEHLTRNRSLISPSMKRTIIQSCRKVMVSDLETVRSELDRILEIGRALGFSDAEIEDIIAATPD